MKKTLLMQLKQDKKKISGVLKRSGKNPRYFAGETGEPVYLTGSHTWSNIQEYLGTDPDRKFDYETYLDWMEYNGFNFIRGWVWEQASFDNCTDKKVCIGPLPYARTGPGTALDGELLFDLGTFNQEYFDRLRRRVIEAGKRGIYVSVMLFNRWSINMYRIAGAKPWDGHPYNKHNNINGVDGDPKSVGGRAIHTLAIPDALRCQENYVKKVIDTVNDLENVIYEIGNEHYEDSWQWQYHMICFIKDYEAGKPLQHMVGMTSGGGEPDAVTNKQLFESPADWVSPRDEDGMPYSKNPPVADGSKVIITDTDHLWGLGGNVDWVWKSLTRGLNPTLMDPYEPIYGLENFGVDEWSRLNNRNHPIWEPIRNNMTYAGMFAGRMKLEAVIPRADLASSGYCLAEYGHEYLVYVPVDKEVTVNLGDDVKKFSIEWLDTHDGKHICDSIAAAKGRESFTNPFNNAAILYLIGIE